MSDLAIRVEKLGKQYRIGATQPGYRTFREALIDGVTAPINRMRGLAHTAEDRAIWALRDVSFEVRRGEVLGIIGRNGAGKTTLLRILSRITEPTEGCAELYGRVGSLLEVGTGFHPELTGRDNIDLNGAILGMRKAEIGRKFDEIVAFAEVEKFIDTPVKHYSSGMHMRLAFAVAAHLEPDILLVDEVLAVGDAAFQRKCLGKMGEVAKEGRTVLFVSHNMTMILNLCRRGILLDNGRITASGPIDEVVERYLSSAVPATLIGRLGGHARDGSGGIRFKEFGVTDDQGNPWLHPNRPAIFRMTLETDVQGLHSSQVTVAFAVSTSFGERLIEFHTKFDKEYQSEGFVFGKTTNLICRTSEFPLKPGTYYLSLYVDCNGELCDRLKDSMRIEVREADYFGTGALPSSSTQGWLLLEQRWRRD